MDAIYALLATYEQTIPPRLSYSLSLLQPLIAKRGLKFAPTRKAGLFTATGIAISFPNRWELSVQTDPLICGAALAELALLHAGKLFTGSSSEFGDVFQVDSPEQFDALLQRMLTFAEDHQEPPTPAPSEQSQQIQE